MKIVVKLTKAGRIIAQSEFDAGEPGDIMKAAGKAFKRFRKEHPNISLLDDDVTLKFDKA
jgi:hypothetical protein